MGVLLDTNILLRYAKPTDPAHPIVIAAITALQTVGEEVCVVPQNFYEFSSSPRARSPTTASA